MSVFAAVEQRNNQRFAELLYPDFAIHWPRSLPYGSGKGRTWSEEWIHGSWVKAKMKLWFFGDNAD